MLNQLAVYLLEDPISFHDSLCTFSKLILRYIIQTHHFNFILPISCFRFREELALLTPCYWNWHALPQPLWLTMKRWGRWPRRPAGKTGAPQPAAAAAASTAAESSGRSPAKMRVKCGRIGGKVVRWKGDLEKNARKISKTQFACIFCWLEWMRMERLKRSYHNKT